MKITIIKENEICPNKDYKSHNHSSNLFTTFFGQYPEPTGDTKYITPRLDHTNTNKEWEKFSTNLSSP